LGSASLHASTRLLCLDEAPSSGVPMGQAWSGGRRSGGWCKAPAQATNEPGRVIRKHIRHVPNEAPPNCVMGRKLRSLMGLGREKQLRELR
jgi:hypothetical protein